MVEQDIIVASAAFAIPSRMSGGRISPSLVESVSFRSSISWKITTATKTFVMLPMPKMLLISISFEVSISAQLVEDDKGMPLEELMAATIPGTPASTLSCNVACRAFSTRDFSEQRSTISNCCAGWMWRSAG